MKGFIVKFKGETCNAGISGNGVTLVASLQRNKLFWNLSGMQFPEEDVLIWNGGDLQSGDEIIVEVAEFEEPSEPVKKISKQESLDCSQNYQLTEEDWQQKLDIYYRLKEILMMQD